MTTAQAIDERYQNEQTQSELDHHTPTAGAMVTHVLSNLKFQAFKLTQYWWYGKAHQDLFHGLYTKNQASYLRVAETMLDNRELVPTTLKEVQAYTFLEENGRNKYFDAQAMLKDTDLDFQKSNLFITRAIKLAEKEGKYSLYQAMMTLLAENEHAIAQIEAQLGYHVDMDDEA